MSASPDAIADARLFSHHAIQWPSRAARANLPAAADDSHSNLGWDSALGALISHPLGGSKDPQLGFRFADGALLWLTQGTLRATFPLVGADARRAVSWCDALLKSTGLAPLRAGVMPYELATVDLAALGRRLDLSVLQALGSSYNRTHPALTALVAAHGPTVHAAPQPRCWPHHFDLATLLALEAGDPETALSIGVGLSPGDGGIEQPYLYCTPWPAPGDLPDAPEGWQWHQQGFTALVYPLSSIPDGQDFAPLCDAAFATARRVLVPPEIPL